MKIVITRLSRTAVSAAGALGIIVAVERSNPGVRLDNFALLDAARVRRQLLGGIWRLFHRVVVHHGGAKGASLVATAALSAFGTGFSDQGSESAPDHGFAVTDTRGGDAFAGIGLEATAGQIARRSTLEGRLAAVPSAEAVVLAPLEYVSVALAFLIDVPAWLRRVGAQTRTLVDPVGDPVEPRQVIDPPATGVTP